MDMLTSNSMLMMDYTYIYYETKLYPGQPVKCGDTRLQNEICYF